MYKRMDKEREHRIIMKSILLEALGEIFPNKQWDVHHKDGDKSNNDIFNLEVVEHNKHMSYDRCGKYRGTCYTNKDRNPWTKVWRTWIKYNGYKTELGYFNDPLSGEIVYDIVYNEIRGVI